MNQGHVSNYFEVSLSAIQLQTLAEWSGTAYTPSYPFLTTYPLPNIPFSRELEQTRTRTQRWRLEGTEEQYGKVRALICVWQKTNNSNELS